MRGFMTVLQNDLFWCVWPFRFPSPSGRGNSLCVLLEIRMVVQQKTMAVLPCDGE
jgi:hypothetical protein